MKFKKNPAVASFLLNAHDQLSDLIHVNEAKATEASTINLLVTQTTYRRNQQCIRNTVCVRPNKAHTSNPTPSPSPCYATTVAEGKSLALTDVRQKGLEGKRAIRRQERVSSVIVLTPIGLVSATSVGLHRKLISSFFLILTSTYSL